MANFWRDDPRAGDASDNEATRGTNILFPPPHCDWPADFAERVGDVEIRCEGCAAPAVALEDVVTRLDGGAVAPGDLLTEGTFFDCLETIGCEARAGGADEDVATAPARQGPTEAEGLAELDASALARVEAAFASARAAGVSGAEEYDGAWIAKRVRQAACPKTFADCIECDMAKLIEATRTEGYGRYEIHAYVNDAVRASLGSSSSDDGSDEDGGMPTYGYGCTACHHAADGCIACRAVDDRCFGDDFGPTADVDYSDSSSEDDGPPPAKRLRGRWNRSIYEAAERARARRKARRRRRNYV